MKVTVSGELVRKAFQEASNVQRKKMYNIAPGLFKEFLHTFGSRYEKDGNEYMLCAVDDNHVVMINCISGYRWKDVTEMNWLSGKGERCIPVDEFKKKYPAFTPIHVDPTDKVDVEIDSDILNELADKVACERWAGVIRQHISNVHLPEFAREPEFVNVSKHQNLRPIVTVHEKYISILLPYNNDEWSLDAYKLAIVLVEKYGYSLYSGYYFSEAPKELFREANQENPAESIYILLKK